MAKKLILFAMVAATVGAFVAPAAAMAEPHYTYEGGPIPGGRVEVKYEGDFAFRNPESSLGEPIGISCSDAVAEVTVEDTSAEVTNFYGFPCVGTDAFEECELQGPWVAGLEFNWPIVPLGESITFNEISLTASFKPGCEVSGIPISAWSDFGDTLHLKLAEPGNLDELTFEGQLGQAWGETPVSGTLTLVDPVELGVELE